MKRVVVVGGGIAGLAAAYELRKGGAEVVLIEKERLGGVIRTDREGGFLLEAGPDSFLTTKPWAKELCEEIGLGDRIIPSASRGFFVYSGGKLHPMPEGMFLTVPTKIWPFLTSGLISFCGKMRMGLDLILPRGAEVEDESIGSFVRRRLGAEALEMLAEPVMAGIHVASADELSLRSTFPRFAEMEREHRSLIKALRRLPVTGNVSPFASLRGGMSELVDRLVERLAGVKLVVGRAVGRIEPGWKVRVGGETLEADEVVLAIPTHAASKLWPGIPAVRYASTATVSLAYRQDQELGGTGFVIPRKEGRRILACTWSSSKFTGRAPSGHILVRCFMKDPQGDVAAVSHQELRDIMGLSTEPVLSKVSLWPSANPIYEVGHERRMREFEEKLPAGLHLCGSGFHGTGIPDAIRDGRAVARRILG